MRAFKTAYRELVWAHCVAPRILRRERTDLLHETVTLMIPPPKTSHTVLTIHDLAFLENPRRFRRWERWSWRQHLKRLPSVDRVICISRFTANEVLRLCQVPAAKLEVVYNGGDFHPDEPPPKEQPPTVPLPAEFFLFVGSLEPGKNLALLKATYRLAEQRGQRLPPLLIVGARWEGVATEGPPPHDWHYLGRQPDAVLVYLYRRARALVFPSKYEGFGLPVVEAMALGCPVICSPVASLSEVGGEAAFYAELRPEAYGDAMRRLGADDPLRRELIEKGLRQARKFSWKRCAEETAEVYRRVLST
jgi:glycosyltransferase involved in cell wall biosynthesis